MNNFIIDRCNEIIDSEKDFTDLSKLKYLPHSGSSTLTADVVAFRDEMRKIQRESKCVIFFSLKNNNKKRITKRIDSHNRYFPAPTTHRQEGHSTCLI